MMFLLGVQLHLLIICVNSQMLLNYSSIFFFQTPELFGISRTPHFLESPAPRTFLNLPHPARNAHPLIECPTRELDEIL